MICSITGEVAKEPVLSPKSGAIFEKKYAVNYISTSGKDPINDEPVTVEELIPVNTSGGSIVPPQVPAPSSIPSLLSTFQNEWDALALEVFTLRKQLHKAREELSALLYHQDAAVRVAAKAIRERDEAQGALQELATSIGNGEVIKPDSIAPTTNGTSHIPSEEIENAREELFQIHKAQKPTLNVTPEQTVTIKLVKSHIQPFKKVSAVFVNQLLKTILIGSPSGSTSLFSLSDSVTEKITHKGQVHALNYVQREGEFIPIIAYKDIVVIGQSKREFNTDQNGFIGILTHPTLSHLFVLISGDSWSLNDVEQGVLIKLPLELVQTGDIHVDGALISLGNKSGEIEIFNLATSESALKLTTKYSSVEKLKFALNGYWLFAMSSSEDKYALEVFDLRKSTVVHVIEFEQLIDFTVDPSTSIIITVDHTGFSLHRYIKKGKKWVDNHSHTPIEDSKSTIRSIDVITDVNDNEFVEQSTVKIAAVAENSALLEYELSYS